MRETKLLISPLDSFAMDVLNRLANEGHDDKVSIFPGYFSAMFQAGVDSFVCSLELLELADDSLAKSDFVIHHAEKLDMKLWWQLFFAVRRAFSPFLKDSKETLIKFQHFLTKLLYAFEKKVCIGCPLELLDVESMRGKIVPELFYLIKNFDSAMVQHETTIPMPVSEFLKNDVGNFLQLISSDMYGSYTTAAAKIDDLNCDDSAALVRVEQVGRRLCKEYKRSLTMQRALVSTLETGAKVAGLAGGKLVDALGKGVARFLADSISTKSQRVVIYRYNRDLMDFVTPRMVEGILKLQKNSGENIVDVVNKFFT